MAATSLAGKAELGKVTRELLATRWSHLSRPHLPTETWQQSKQKFLWFMQDFSHPSCPLASSQAVLQIKAASSSQQELPPKRQHTYIEEHCTERSACPKFCSLLILLSKLSSSKGNCSFQISM